MKSKRDLEEIIATNKVLETKYANALSMALEIQKQMEHQIPNHLALNPLLTMIIHYARLLDEKTVKHGNTLYGYGCRCEVCVETKKKWAREYAKVKEARKRYRGNA